MTHSLKPVTMTGKNKNSPAAILHNLSLTLDLRCPLHLDFFLQDKFLFQRSGSIFNVSDRQIRIMLASKITTALSLEITVKAYFFLQHGYNVIPFSFQTVLHNPALRRTDTELTLVFPDTMNHTQRRYSLRVDVEERDVSSLKLWLARRKETGLAGSAYQTVWAPIEPEHIRLLNISASGALVSVAKDSEVHPFIGTQDTMLLGATFGNPCEIEPAPLIMAALVKRVKTGEKSPVSNIGLSFRQWARMEAEGLTWREVTVEDGIAALGPWIAQLDMRRIARERKLA